MAVMDQYFRETLRQGASDLHMVIGRPPMLRVRGDMVPTTFPIITQKSNREMLFELVDQDQRERIESHLDLDFAYELKGVARFRGNMFYQHRGLGAVFRLIPESIISLEQLRMPPVLKKIGD